MRDDHERLMERLRAADPVPTPPAPPTFEALLGDADPTPAPPAPDVARPPARRARLPRRPQLAVGLGAMLVLLVAIVVALGPLGSGGGSRVDVVARAQAEISPSGEVVHLVLRGGLVQPDGTPLPSEIRGADGTVIGQLSRVTEQWSTALPLRYLSRTSVLGSDGKPVATAERGESGDGISWEDNSWESRVRFGTNDSLDPDAANTINGLGANPINTVRSMLAAGTLRPNGETTFDNRRVLRLTGEMRIPTAPGARSPQITASRLDYLVDPSDYAPVGFQRSVRLPPVPGVSGPGPLILSTELTVERYEVLPLDATTRALFRPPPRNP